MELGYRYVYTEDVDVLIPVICLLVGLALGGLAWGLAQRSRMADLRERADRLEKVEGDLTEALSARAAAETRAQQAEEWKLLAQEREQKVGELLVRQKGIDTLLAERERAFEEHRQLMDQMKEKLADAFKALSADALNKNNQAFLDLAKQSLEAFSREAKRDLDARQENIVKLTQPIEKSLEGMNKVIVEFNEKYEHQMGGVSRQLQTVVEMNNRLQLETNNLVKALKNPHQKGQWGEVQLRRIVELAGMLEHCDFDEQTRESTNDGTIQPDLVVKLPGGRLIAVDAKAPTSAYLAAMEEDQTDEQRAQALKQHAIQVREHMRKLGSKEYWSKLDGSMDFVVMFLAMESLQSTAFHAEPGLFEEGLRNRVLICSPTTLIALLQTVAYTWRQEQIQENAENIAKLGREIYERLGNLGVYMARLGSNLDSSVTAFNDAVGSFEGRLLVSGRKMRDLGLAGGGKEIQEVKPIEKSTREFTAPEVKALIAPGLFDD